MLAQTITAPTMTETDGVPGVLRYNVQEAVIECFDKICGVASSNIAERDAESCDGIVGIISFVGDVTWSLILGLPHESAVRIAEQFAGFEIPFDSADMGDVIGELANVLAGVINGRLESAGITVHMSLPTVARGSDVELLLPGNLTSEWLHFSTIDQPFWVKLVVAKAH